MHAHGYHHRRRARVTWALCGRWLVACQRSAIHDDGRETLYPDLARRRADQHVAWRIAGWVFRCRGASNFSRYLRHSCRCRDIHLVEVFVKASRTVSFCSTVPPNLSLNSDASPAALARRPLGAG